MCIVIAAVGMAPQYPVIVGANRDEDASRQGTAPELLVRSPRAWGGRDLRAGGSWMGINEHGVIVVLTNRHTPDVDPTRRSRGLLVLDLLREPGAEAVVAALRADAVGRPYNHFNLFCADRHGAWVVHYTGEVYAAIVPPGVHVLSHAELDDPVQPKARRARQLALAEPLPRSAADWIARLKSICSDEDPAVPPPERICVRTNRFVTLSSSILALHESGVARSTYLHCIGLPGAAPYVDYSGLLALFPAQG